MGKQVGIIEIYANGLVNGLAYTDVGTPTEMVDFDALENHFEDRFWKRGDKSKLYRIDWNVWDWSDNPYAVKDSTGGVTFI